MSGHQKSFWGGGGLNNSTCVCVCVCAPRACVCVRAARVCVCVCMCVCVLNHKVSVGSICKNTGYGIRNSLSRHCYLD